MKFLAVIFSFLFAFNANAGLITTQSDQDNYSVGETVVVDFFVNDANPLIDWLNVDFSFDDSLFAFNSFTITDDVFFSRYYDDGYDIGDLLVLELGLLPNWSDILTTSFKWGQAEFIALSDVSSPAFNVVNIIAQDNGFNDIAPQEVPEPATLAIFPLIAGLLFMRRRQK